MVFSSAGASFTSTGAIGFSVERFSFQVRIDAERERRPLRACGGVGEDPETLGEIGDVVEQQRGTGGGAGRNLRDAANLETLIGAGNTAQCADAVNLRDELSQVPVHALQDSQLAAEHDLMPIRHSISAAGSF
jgi:hypothetical protein